MQQLTEKLGVARSSVASSSVARWEKVKKIILATIGCHIENASQPLIFIMFLVSACHICDMQYVT